MNADKYDDEDGYGPVEPVHQVSSYYDDYGELAIQYKRLSDADAYIEPGIITYGYDEYGVDSAIMEGDPWEPRFTLVPELSDGERKVRALFAGPERIEMREVDRLDWVETNPNMPPSAEAFAEAAERGRWWPHSIDEIMEEAGIPPWGIDEQLSIERAHDFLVNPQVNFAAESSLQWGWGFYREYAKVWADRVDAYKKRVADYAADIDRIAAGVQPYKINLIAPARPTITAPDWTTTPPTELSFEDLTAAYARGELTSRIDEDGRLVVSTLARDQRISNQALSEILHRVVRGGPLLPKLPWHERLARWIDRIFFGDDHHAP